MIFYLRAFEKYGFIIQMFLYCIQDLGQFIFFYILLLFLFTCCFYILKEEVWQLTSDNVAQNLPYFFQLFIFQYQTSLEYLFVPHYNKRVLKQEPINNYGVFANPIQTNTKLQVVMIWILWFALTYLINILMINFIVAIIICSYEEVKNKERIISFRLRADINHEAFQIAYYLDYLHLHRLVEVWQGKDEQFKIIVMSTSVHIYDMEQA